MHILFLLLPYNLLFIFMGMRAPDWAMNIIIRTLEKKKYMWWDVIYWVIPEKILTPPTEGMAFWPSPHPFHLNFQNCLSSLLRISKFKDPPTHLDFHEIVRHHNFNLHLM